MRLYGYWRSSASWRVRIALAWKRLPYDYVAVHLVRGGGEQRSPAHRARNPMAQLPVLELDDGGSLSQSVAILEYLEERYPTPALLPSEPVARARVRCLTEIVNSGIQPLQNLSVLGALEQAGVDPRGWARRVIREGLCALEASAAGTAGRCLVGDAPSFADVALIPQLYNARRYGAPLEDLKILLRVEGYVSQLPAFVAAHADRQPDAERPAVTG